jgi:hypothetical protein
MAQITDRLDSRHRQAQPGESNECEKKKKKKSSNIQEQIVLHSS